MADTAFFKRRLGTVHIWGQPGGTIAPVPTLDLTLRNLGNNVSRQGPFLDLGADWYREWEVAFILETGTAPGANVAAYLYFASTYNVTDVVPGGLSNSDADFQTTQADNNEHLPQLSLVHCLRATQDGNIRQIQDTVLWVPPARHVAPVVYNRLGVALRNNATATDHASRVILATDISFASDTQ